MAYGVRRTAQGMKKGSENHSFLGFGICHIP